MDLSIIIVNWNCAEFTAKCLRSIYSTTRDVRFEIIVVDNASEDDSCRSLAGSFPQVKLIACQSNLGFARANNLGVGQSCGKNILFLNPDTVVLDDAIARLLAQLNSSSEAGAVGAMLLNTDLTLQTSCVQPFPTILNQFLSSDWLMRRTPRLSLWGRQALFGTCAEDFRPVESVSGACIMLKRKVGEKVGFFSTDYFMYAEDKDLCCKIQRAGWKVCYVPAARIVHFGGQSTSKKKDDGFAAVLVRESGFKFLQKFRGKTYARLYRLAMCAAALLRLFMLSAMLALPNRWLNRQDLIPAFRKWRRVARWSLGLEGWCKQLGREQPAVFAAKQ